MTKPVAHPRGIGTDAMSRELLRPHGSVSRRPREAAGDWLTAHQVAVSWTLRNGVTRWRATCGHQTGRTPDRAELMPPGSLLERTQSLWSAALYDPTEVPESLLCRRCYPMLTGGRSTPIRRHLRVAATHPATLPIVATVGAFLLILARSGAVGVAVGLALTWSVFHFLIGDLIPPRPAHREAAGA